MTVLQRSCTYVGVVALLGFFCGAERTAQAQGTPAVLSEQQVNHVVGPDTIPGNADDDDPADQPHIKGHNETTIALIRGADGWPVKIFGSWNDESWKDSAPPVATGRTIGFGVSDLLDTDWAEMHNLARSASAEAESGYLPPPEGGQPSGQWSGLQQDPVAAVIPRHSGITGVHLAGMDGPWSGARIFYATSPGVPTDDPNDWYVKTIVYGRVDKPYMSVYGPAIEGRPKYICVTWTRTGQIEFAISGDGGDTFLYSAPNGPVGPAIAQNSASTFGPGPPTGEGPYLYVVWFDDSHDRIAWRRGLVVPDPNAGPPSVTWEPPLGDPNDVRVVAAINPLRFGVTGNELVNFHVTDQASIVVDHTCARAGWVYVCYASEVNPGVDVPDGPCDTGECQPDVFVSRLAPGETEFESAVKVNDDTAYPRTVQVMPWIAMDDRGHVGVGFYDRRDDPNNKLQHYYLACSDNGAATFSANAPVSTDPSDTYPDLDVPQQPAVFIGDYTSLGGANASFFGLWCDTRNWITTEVPDPRERVGDIFFAEVVVELPPDFDADCDVDLDDFSKFAACFNGANRPPAPGCPEGTDADFDADCDVDLDDFAVFGACNNGANNPPNPACPYQTAQCQQQGMGGDAPGEGAGGGSADSQPPDDPSSEELYWMLYEYCQENDIPFT